MEKLNILYIGMHPEIRETVVRVIAGNGRWQARSAGSEEEALRLLPAYPFRLVLLGCGIEPGAEKRLREYIAGNHPGTVVVQHYGGGSGLLLGEISMALEKGQAGELDPSGIAI